MIFSPLKLILVSVIIRVVNARMLFGAQFTSLSVPLVVYVMQRPAKGDVNFAPIVVNGTVVRDKEFLRGLGKVLKLQWLLGKSVEA